ncbi:MULTISPECIES: hypothetical protein [Proteus]|uniref:Uncharacterized protein n=1 Tax=Proteus terrae subsp. cibarius TaxID=626774 RepID=A0A6G6SSR3_9GAMM|nr:MULTISPECIES: hypothetical protein [Proteus]ATN00965.1 hypothetical protein CRN77_15035 [Proteus vulgaris]MBG2916329.1 hypothetical protein [Proteus terrae subsp. cibarius]MCE9841673.1 hypothetical protein [Proteus terrae]MCO4183018.1 hypothetical protein [Proteus terrae]MCO4191354.1 hypothetical protein [Proteus terrae]
MPLISLIKSSNGDNENEVLYRTFHERNARYLERENQSDKFKIIWNIDDASPSVFMNSDDLVSLLEDLEILVQEACKNNDHEILNHLKEIAVLCKLCLWNESLFYLEFSPWGVSLDSYPTKIPEQYRFNISTID